MNANGAQRQDAGPPWPFRLARHLIARGVPGGFAVLRLLKAAGRLNGAAAFTLPDGSAIRMPLDWPQLWRQDLFTFYERRALDLVAAAADRFGRPALLVDGGADIGLYARLLMARARSVQAVIAVEPNTDALALLRDNLSRPGVTAEVVAGALGERPGWGRLTRPHDGDSAHAAFVVPGTEDTGLALTTVDALVATPHDRTLILKLDVEGSEAAVLRGAAATIAAAPHAILQVEAHPDVARRTGVDPATWIDFARSIRPFRWTACVERSGTVFAARPLDGGFFAVHDPRDIYDVVLVSD